MQITVNVDSVDLTSEIGWRYDDEGEKVPRTLGDEVVNALVTELKVKTAGWRSLQERVEDLRVEEIREQLKPIVADAIAQGVRKTNHYGEPVGEPTTLRSLIVDEVGKLLNRPVDNYSRDKGSWASALVKAEVEKALRAELGAAIADEKAKVVAAVRAKAAELIATAVKEGVGR